MIESNSKDLLSYRKVGIPKIYKIRAVDIMKGTR